MVFKKEPISRKLKPNLQTQTLQSGTHLSNTSAPLPRTLIKYSTHYCCFSKNVLREEEDEILTKTKIRDFGEPNCISKCICPIPKDARILQNAFEDISLRFKQFDQCFAGIHKQLSITTEQ